MNFSTPPYLSQNVSVQRVMLQVLAALLPAIAAYVWLLGPAVLLQLIVASVTALLAEAAMLKLRDKPLALFLGDGSAIVTAWLVALAFPPLAPWWLTVVGVLFAIVVAKHLYGGLGQNPFNPAMIAFAVCIVSFPALMSQWPPVDLKAGVADQLALIFGFAPRIDTMSGATPLDALKTALKLGEGATSVAQIVADGGTSGQLAGRSADFGYGSAKSSVGTRRWPSSAASRYPPLRSGCGIRASSPTRCSTCCRAELCSALSSSSPIRYPGVQRPKARSFSVFRRASSPISSASSAAIPTASLSPFCCSTFACR
jgi:hypothetical protein